MQDTPNSRIPDHSIPDLSVPDLSIVEWVADWGAEVAAADIRSARHRFDEELIAFGTYADVVVGRDAVEAGQWSHIWPAIEDFEFLLEDLRVRLSPDGLMAVAIVPWSSSGIDADGNPFDRPGRATIVLERDAVGAPWSGTHTHFSLARGVPASTHGRREAIR
jgi:ketosteroid isomerase-like protein